MLCGVWQHLHLSLRRRKLPLDCWVNFAAITRSEDGVGQSEYWQWLLAWCWRPIGHRGRYCSAIPVGKILPGQ